MSSADESAPATESDGKADDMGEPQANQTSQAGVNLSRYRAATAGCWIADPGYWNPNCPIISAEEAVSAMMFSGITKVKLFAPGHYPENEYSWYFPMWVEDLAALSQSPASFDLFIGIPNSALFQLAGLEFSMTCGSGAASQIFYDVHAAFTSTKCGETEEERHHNILRSIMSILQDTIEEEISISCSSDDQVRTFNNALEAYSSGACNMEEIHSVLVQALLDSEGFMSDLTGPESWLDEYVTHIIDSNSTVAIEYLGVGNEPFAPWYHDFYDAVVLVAMAKTQNYITQSSLPVLASATVTVPFAGTYASEPILIEQVLRFLEEVDSVFVQNIYPHGDVFYSTLNYVLDQQRLLQPDLDVPDDEEPEILLVTEQSLIFVKDFIAWATGEEVSPNHDFGTDTFYQAYIAGYQNALAQNFSRSYNLPIVAGETGWPTKNNVVYFQGTEEERASLRFDDLDFVDSDGQLIATVGYLEFKQMISNEIFNSVTAARFVQSTVEYWNSTGNSGYLFELHDEANKMNEAEGTEFELEPFFGIFELTQNENGEVTYDSELRPKFSINFFATTNEDIP